MASTEWCSCNCNGSEWKVQLAQFVPPPALHADKKSVSPFKTLNKRFFPTDGTWISSRSPAILSLSTANSATKLHVKLRGKVHEEHLISRLKFMWPQIPCQAKLDIKGGRVIFASYYRECLHKGFERSKFSLQFDTALHARDFLSVIQSYGAGDCAFPNQEMLQANKFLQVQEEIPRRMILWDESSASKLLAIHKPQASENIDGVPLDKSDTQKQGMNSSMKVDQSQELLERQKLFNQLESNCADLPPRFTKYLQERHMASGTETDKGNTQWPQNLQNDPPDVESNPNDLKAQVTACFLDPSFQ
ncbi:hypothetical protein KI387_002891, partial [Taxus chinensis]